MSLFKVTGSDWGSELFCDFLGCTAMGPVDPGAERGERDVAQRKSLNQEGQQEAGPSDPLPQEERTTLKSTGYGAEDLSTQECQPLQTPCADTICPGAVFPGIRQGPHSGSPMLEDIWF